MDIKHRLMSGVVVDRKPLKELNTFRVNVFAKYFTEIYSKYELLDVLKNPEYKDLPKLIIGEGSNILFTKNFKGLVVKLSNNFIDEAYIDDKSVTLRVGAGLSWDELVKHCVIKGYGGIENLSDIPGTVGAAPVQNIGAYGAELNDVVSYVEYLDLDDLEVHEISRKKCKFGYRNSIFKNELKGRAVILNVELDLTRGKHDIKLDYGNLRDRLAKIYEGEGKSIDDIKEDEIPLHDIRRAVIEERRSKLPSYSELGNGGSFFKNPVVSVEQYNEMKQKFPNLPGYEVEEGIKIPAGWIIEQCGWKGRKMGNCGVHDKQALVLVNYGFATGLEIKELSDIIMDDVKRKLGIQIEPEINII